MIDFISSNLTEITVAIFGIVALLQILYYVILFSRFAFHKQPPHKPVNPPISIVVTAKNDAHHLIHTLPVLLTQDYHQYEVVVVNDKSNDETLQVLLDFHNRFPNLRIVNLESSVTNIKGKKFPLSIGIKAANYEHVLLTDADCLPASNQWVKLTARHFDDKTKIVLGFGKIREKFGLLNALIRFDRFHQAIQYFSYCLTKIPFMGSGQNLAYTKTIFFNNNGFASQNHLQFGDDDLFVNKIATANNSAIEYDKAAHTISRFGSNFYYWFLLKTFRIRTRKYYKRTDRFLLNFYDFLISFFYLSFGFSLAFSLNYILYLSIVLGIFAIKIVTQYICFGFSASKLNEMRLIPYFLFFEIVFAVLNPLAYLVSKFKK